MADYPLLCLLIIPEYRPGDKPPEGYLQWHAWADVQHKARTGALDLPIDERRISKEWLENRGLQSLDDGDL